MKQLPELEHLVTHIARPSIWCRDVLGFEPDVNQIEYLDHKGSDEILLWGRQLGKTRCTAYKLVHRCRFNSYTQALICSSSLRQAAIAQKWALSAILQLNRKNRGWRKVRTVEIPEDPLKDDSRLVKASVLSLELGNGSEIISVPGGDGIRGFSPDILAMDEASRISDNGYIAVRPLKTAHPMTLILCSTPAGPRGFFHAEWTSDDPDWWRSFVKTADCPRVSKEFLSKERQKLSASMYAQEYECAFVSMEGSVFSAEEIKSIFGQPGEAQAEQRREWEKSKNMLGKEGSFYNPLRGAFV